MPKRKRPLRTILVVAMLLVIVAIDRPFTGALKVGPEPLVEVLHDLGPPRPAR